MWNRVVIGSHDVGDEGILTSNTAPAEVFSVTEVKGSRQTFNYL